MEIFKTIFGSHVYGTNVPSSDLDLKAVFIPSRRDILLQRAPRTIVRSTKQDGTTRNGPDDVDTESFSLQQYLKLLMEGQTVALDMIFTPESFWHTKHEIWFEIQRQKKHFFSKKSAAFVGYCRQQANKYGIKGSRVAAVRAAINALLPISRDARLEEIKEHLFIGEHAALIEVTHPKGVSTYYEVCNRKFQMGNTVLDVKRRLKLIFDEYGHRALQAEENMGVDWKALMHAVRVINEAKEFLFTGEITQPRPEKELLLRIRKGEMAYKEVAEIIEQGVIDVEISELTSPLPDEPNYKFADDFVEIIYESAK